jgi:hypothetical protein
VPSTSRPQTCSNGTTPDEVLDVDAAVAQRAAPLSGSAISVAKGNDALEARLDVGEVWGGSVRGHATNRRKVGSPACPPRRHDRLLFRPVTELATSIRSGELSARELVQASLDRIEEVNPKVNAFVDVFAEEALAEADGIGADDPRPFAGVPIAIKNNRAIEGKRLTFAAEFAGDFRARSTTTSWTSSGRRAS